MLQFIIQEQQSLGLVTATTFVGDGSALTGINFCGNWCYWWSYSFVGSGVVVGTAGSVSTLDFNGSGGVTVMQAQASGTAGATGIHSRIH